LKVVRPALCSNSDNIFWSQKANLEPLILIKKSCWPCLSQLGYVSGYSRQLLVYYAIYCYMTRIEIWWSWKRKSCSHSSYVSDCSLLNVILLNQSIFHIERLNDLSLSIYHFSLLWYSLFKGANLWIYFLELLFDINILIVLRMLRVYQRKEPK
jgi:hypothetical protein